MINKEMNMCEGAIFRKMAIYAFPLIITNVLQLLFNAADVAVLGIFDGDSSVAAVSSNGALIGLIVSLFVGISVGANVLIARCVGENNPEKAHRTVGTSIVVSVLLGAVLLVIGFFGARTFLQWMKSDPEVIDLAVEYLQIYFLGMPVMMLYNVAAAILRAVGDTVRPLIFLVVAGVANVLLNLFFVVVIGNGVKGVGIATVLSQLIAAILCVITLIKNDGYSKFGIGYFRIYPKELCEMFRIGIPAGIQGCLFSISNVFIQTEINLYGVNAVAGNGIAGQLDGIIYQAMYGIELTALAFVSQNYGAGNIKRTRKIVLTSVLFVSVVGMIMSTVIVSLGRVFGGMMSKDPAVVDYVMIRLVIVGIPYFLCGIMDVLSNAIRGVGHSALAMIITLAGTLVFRLIYLSTVYQLFKTIEMVYVIYPASYVLTTAILLAVYFPMMKKIEKEKYEEPNLKTHEDLAENAIVADNASE